MHIRPNFNQIGSGLRTEEKPIGIAPAILTTLLETLITNPAAARLECLTDPSKFKFQHPSIDSQLMLSLAIFFT